VTGSAEAVLVVVIETEFVWVVVKSFGASAVAVSVTVRGLHDPPAQTVVVVWTVFVVDLSWVTVTAGGL
jgi:hypothetical protein